MVRTPIAVRTLTLFGLLLAHVASLGSIEATPEGTKSPAPDANPIREIDSSLEKVTLSRFRFDASAMPVGTVFFYRKSNIDGSHASTIATYVASNTRIESLKWTPGSGRSTLVAAEMDWSTQSVEMFQTWHVFADGRRDPRMSARADSASRMLVVTSPGGSFETPIVMYPWHNYDFDFASLALSMRHLRDPEQPFTVTIIDRTFHDGEQKFGYKGTIEVRYVGDEKRYEIACRKYAVDGQGLENRGGFMWFDRNEGHLVDYEIDLPDEPGYESGKLRLLRLESLTPGQWEDFVNSSVTE